MKRLLFFIYLLLSFISVQGQSGSVTKPLIDSIAYKNWTFVEGAHISSNGKYMCYIIRTKSACCDTTILKSCDGRWRMKIPGGVGIALTPDDKYAVYILNDTLYTIKLGSFYLEKLPMMNSMCIPSRENGGWIVVGNSLKGEFLLKNLNTGHSKMLTSVRKVTFSDDSKVLLLEKEYNYPSGVKQSLNILDIADNLEVKIWEGKGLGTVLLNTTATRIIFMAVVGNDTRKSIWCYNRGSTNPRLLQVDSWLDKDSSLVIDDLYRLSDDGNEVFLTLKKKANLGEVTATSSTVSIWSYLDKKLQPVQTLERDNQANFTAVVRLDNSDVTRIDYDNDLILNYSINDKICLLQHVSGGADGLDGEWTSAGQITYFLRFIKDTSSVFLNLKGSSYITLSPNGKFVIYYDSKKHSYFSYSVESGSYRNITDGLNVSWNNSIREDMGPVPRGVAAWIGEDKNVLIYDRFDIWLIDPNGIKPPQNITNGYGLKHRTIFSLALSGSSRQVLDDRGLLILNAFDLSNKQNGFFRKDIFLRGDPLKLIMDDCIYHLVGNPYLSRNTMFPIKATSANKYIVLRMKANESPNYFFTSDFQSFIQQSSVYPEKAYNWFTTELHTWMKDDGTQMDGVLYKPENFDPQKKYPVIFTYYEKKSFGLNEYLFPENIGNYCNINIPTFVSNGYLIFTPDINYVIGDPMQGAYDAVVSAANYLSRLRYVSGNKMGLGGCSFGGLQTNYLITHTNLFAAAYSSSSMCDLISAYGDIPRGNRSLQSYFELGQGRMGGTLWQIPEKYIKNSPIFSADRVNTPLLLMHTTDDGVYSFAQAIEFFTALRRLGKRVWLLEYPNSNHGILGDAAKDFGIRLNQFFDHYLKDMPAPYWMTRGVPVKMKGIDNGYKLDSSIITPGKGLLMKD